ncbi:hypothetical protein BDZ94DRAFT_1270200 [Collybia nuda]|uniref:Translation initiation factor IF-2, mitochondrial n=1 Tax=Collybia nuda TaxID=64659 RepID=A0A9P5XX45_9AGAR|nr:hypothetical protein BDZ94DRAFT_1270200 [Collybia nuda]
MHRHCKVWPIIQCSHSQARSAATATARAKPAIWDTSSEPVAVKAASPGKWALPKATFPPLSGSSLPSAIDSPSYASSSKHSIDPSQSSSLSQWGVSSPSHLSGSPTGTARSLGMSKWTVPQGSPPLGVNAAVNTPSLSVSPLSKGPQQLSKFPTPKSLKKWMKPSSQAPEIHASVPRFSNSYQTSKHANDRQLHRDPAPHQDLLVKNSIDPQNAYRHRSHHDQGSGITQQRQSLIERTFGSRKSPDPQTSRPSAHHLTLGVQDAQKKPLHVVPSVDITGRNLRNSRPNRVVQKERGSLLSRADGDATLSHYTKDTPKPQGPNQVKTRTKVFTEKQISVDIYIPTTVSVGTLARLLGVRLERLQHKMRNAGMSSWAKYDHVLTSDYAVLLAEEFGRNPIVNDEAAFDIYPLPPRDPLTLPPRPPVVTIMGHVDHGKTTLLDTLRSTSVAKGEAGGITQHIGAFSVPVPMTEGNISGPQSITFLDTPGHAAFSAMRARGAGVTDIIVLVVAGDDGIKPQTREVIELIKKDEGKIGVVVAINKVDKPGVNVDTVKKALMAENIQLEEFGGDIPSVEVSGLSGHGLPDLVETLSAIAEMQDLRAEQDGLVHGFVLESKIHKGLGPVATVLVLRGCLKTGSHIISGVSQAKVRVMTNSTGAVIKAALPGTAVTVSGWKTLPNAGDEVLQGTEAEVKKAINNRIRKAEIEASLVDVEAINASRRQEREEREIMQQLKAVATNPEPQLGKKGPKELRLIIKADVSGSAEAVTGALEGIGNKQVITRIVSSGVGEISESDITMAKAVGGMIVGFSVSASRPIEILAAQNDVPIFTSNIIYRLMEDIKDRVIALLPVIIETRVTGEATVLQLFEIQLKAKQTKKVAGCRVTNGLVEKTKFAKVIRDGTVMHEGTLDTIRHLKKDVMEVRKGSECGLSLEGFADLRQGDIIQMYEKVEKPGVL